ncbi:MAG: hypothetical protein JXP34_23485 [Planctomycetes bacterium]|nr:hypothetical protein [Planctomycetota bacterium]
MDRLRIACLPVLVMLGSISGPARAAAGETLFYLESDEMRVDVDRKAGRWSLVDRRSNVRWPSEGTAATGGAAFALVDGDRAVEIRFEGDGDVRALGDALTVTAKEDGYIIVPCREGLLIPATGGKEFRRTFGTSDYEGAHMNMLAFSKAGSALIVTWDDAYVFPEVRAARGSDPGSSRIDAEFTIRRTARSLRLYPLGRTDWNGIASAYRAIAQTKGLAQTLREKIRRDAHAEAMLGAANVKLWTCLNRRMNEESTKEESVTVHWTFDEAAQIAEHIRNDLAIERCLFIIGGWTEGGYDCRHPDNLPANPECGGNEGLADAVRRIQGLGYVLSLHDNYQDMYRDAKSWDPKAIEKRPDGSLITGGRWLGGRAYMVCAPKQLEYAKRPQNLPGIHALFPAWSYFIDTTYAVGPRECYDPEHPIGRNEDIAWKIKLSDYAREVFGLFGSECGREWALPHSDFFEGLVGVSGRYYHNLKPEEMGAIVIPFFEMVYHDCQVAYGKYGYDASKAAEYVAHHVLCARPLHYHSIPKHLYWKNGIRTAPPDPRGVRHTRCDAGWAESMHPVDVFLKNTQEVLGPLNAATAQQTLAKLEFLSDDRSLRRATYGEGDDATIAVVNFGSADAEATLPLGGKVLLPPFGFAIEGPRFAAFCAKRWGGRDYPDVALFTIRSAVDAPPAKAARVRIFHGYGDPSIPWAGRTHEVRRQAEIARGS